LMIGLRWRGGASQDVPSDIRVDCMAASGDKRLPCGRAGSLHAPCRQYLDTGISAETAVPSWA
jgi:hypothetical protein